MADRTIITPASATSSSTAGTPVATTVPAAGGSGHSYVDWGAILAGAVVASAIGVVFAGFGAALGLSALVFKYVFGFAGADASLPLFVFVFLVALGIDYNIFLMTRVREESEVLGTRAGSLVGLTSTGGVITSAGVVLAATFLVLGSLPMVFLAEIGVTVALGVMLDTMIVRSILVTAINLDAGDRIWWPSRLAKPKQE